MPDRLSLHAPILVNTIGHCAGAIMFGVLMYLFIVDWRRDPDERSPLPCIASGLALLWNLGSLIGLATPPRGAAVADAIVAFSFSILSVLPAVLLHISLRPRRTALWIIGYTVSGLAVILHMSDLLTTAPRFHYASILLVTFGFGALALISFTQELASGVRNRGSARLLAAMVLFLFAISFAHFETSHPATPWSGEAALHHAGIPLALFVLLQDYRFLLLDVFIRFVANAVISALTVAVLYSFIFLSAVRWQRNAFLLALVFVAACGLLTLCGLARIRVQRWLTRVIFLRHNTDHGIDLLREGSAQAHGETEYLQRASVAIASFLSATHFELIDDTRGESGGLTADVVEKNTAKMRPQFPSWVHAIAPLHFASGKSRILLLGARAGGRRYLSEDIRALERLSAIVCERIERFRASEMQNLVSQAELRALQAQINPHFLFNSLNTLYGMIDRENAQARALVLNLASLFRYVLASERAFIRLEEEIRIVRAYLEIEQLRLGPKLQASIEIDDEALATDVPVLSIQPLVENAVKHGVAARPGSGFVRIGIHRREGALSIEISNSGPFRKPAPHEDAAGIGLANVRKRLSLCYGDGSDLKIDSEADHTKVSFAIPIYRSASATV